MNSPTDSENLPSALERIYELPYGDSFPSPTDDQDLPGCRCGFLHSFRRFRQRSIGALRKAAHSNPQNHSKSSLDEKSYTQRIQVPTIKTPLPPREKASVLSNDLITEVYRPDVLSTIESTIAVHQTELQKLSINIHDHPEIKFEERYAHDTLTQFMSKHGFNVTRHYLGLATAWRAEFSYGSPTKARTIGLNSEMDALPDIGHACGHNLIAVSGVAVALALKAALEKHRISGRIVLLGTPAEEDGAGKVLLLERGGYKDMDACLMCHPCPGPPGLCMITSCLSVQKIEVEYFGQSAHAAFAPWEGRNALDAAITAYNSVSVLRQQIKPDCRVHGVIDSGDKVWSPNTVPDYARMRWLVRAPTYEQVAHLRQRVESCLRSAGDATGCEVKIKFHPAERELRNNDPLVEEFSRTARSSRCGMSVQSTALTPFSTDFGNITQALPAIHPNFAIPAPQGSSNHAPSFTEATRTPEAHDACWQTCKALALTGFRLLDDDGFHARVRAAFEGRS